LTGILNRVGEVWGNQQKKEELLIKIWEFITRDDFAATAYQERKQIVDELLDKLTGKVSANQQPNSEFPWLKVLVITASITLPIALIGLLLILKNPTKKKKIPAN
jgi:hypothetical protein